MQSILIANSDPQEIDRIQKDLRNNYRIMTITSVEQFDGGLEKCQLILLDQNFTEKKGLDFLKIVVSKIYIPILMVTSPEDPNCASEALSAGAYNYIVKTGNYWELLGFSVEEAIRRSREHEEMKQTIVTLRQRVTKLEERLEKNSPETLQGRDRKDLLAEDKKRGILDEIISSLKKDEVNLPALPEIAIQFKKIIAKQGSISEITELLKKDVAISSRLISVSNSPYYQGLTKNKSLVQAVNRLGLGATRNYVELTANRSLYTIENNEYQDYLKALWKHSLSCAYGAEAIAKRLQLKNPEEIFSMGMLHDIGKLMLLKIIIDLENRGAFSKKADRREVIEILNANHGQFGASLLKKWRYSPEYAQVALWHDNLGEADLIFKELLVIHLANWIVKDMGYGQSEPPQIDLRNVESAKILKFSNELIDETKTEISEMMEKIPQD
ncbi:MAG: HDOD domain-containing protein [Nitrospiria bacterium]